MRVDPQALKNTSWPIIYTPLGYPVVSLSPLCEEPITPPPTFSTSPPPDMLSSSSYPVESIPYAPPTRPSAGPTALGQEATPPPLPVRRHHPSSLAEERQYRESPSSGERTLPIDRSEERDSTSAQNLDPTSSAPKKGGKGFKKMFGSIVNNMQDFLDTQIATPIQAGVVEGPRPGSHSTASQLARKFEDTPLSDQELIEVGQKCLALTNEYRQQQNKPGLATLVWSEDLYWIACQHSLNMSEKSVPFGHDGFTDRVKAFPFLSYASAENVFQCSSRPLSQLASLAVDSWIKSPGHQANLVGRFDTCAIGLCRTADNKAFYFTQLFARQHR